MIEFIFVSEHDSQVEYDDDEPVRVAVPMPTDLKQRHLVRYGSILPTTLL